MRTLEQTSVDVLKHVTALPLGQKVAGVAAAELARAVAGHVTSCPSCGAEPWCNIDCELCSAMHLVTEADRG